MSTTSADSCARLAVLAFAALAVGATSAAARMPHVSLAEMKSGAAFILVGVPIQMYAVKTGPGAASIQTFVTISVVRNIKGDPGTSTVVVRSQGGTVGNESLAVSDEPRFRTGNRMILFLNQVGTEFRVFGRSLGAFTVIDGQVVGQRSSEAEFIDRLAALP